MGSFVCVCHDNYHHHKLKLHYWRAFHDWPPSKNDGHLLECGGCLYHLSKEIQWQILVTQEKSGSLRVNVDLRVHSSGHDLSCEPSSQSRLMADKNPFSLKPNVSVWDEKQIQPVWGSVPGLTLMKIIHCILSKICPLVKKIISQFS